MKAAERIAGVMEEMILRERLRPGTKVGSEPGLMEELGVSRTVFREAVRILEHEGLATMRRGPYGGLFVMEPSSDAVAHAATLWLRYNEADIDDLFEVRQTLESRSAVLAAERIDAAGATELRSLMDAQREAGAEGRFDDYTRLTEEFHETVARLSGNTVTYLFVRTLSELNRHFGAAPHYGEHHITGSDAAHAAIAEAIVAGDGALASGRMRRHLRAARDFELDLLSADHDSE